MFNIIFALRFRLPSTMQSYLPTYLGNGVAGAHVLRMPELLCLRPGDRVKLSHRTALLLGLRVGPGSVEEQSQHPCHVSLSTLRDISAA